MGDGSGWGAVLAGLASIYGQKKKKDAAKDQYKYQQQELARQRQYAEDLYQRKQNAPQAKMARYMMEYYMPQMVEKMKSRNKGGDTSVLDRMLADIMGGIKNGNNSSNSAYMSNSVLTADGERIPRQMRSDGSFGPANTTPGKGQVDYIMGKVNPGLEGAGYNGKTWASRGGSYGLEGAASGGYNPWGVGAGEVGGYREQTRGMGNTTTQTERGYTVKDMPWNMIDEGADQAFPNQQGELATGGTLNVATDGMNVGQIPLGPLRGMLGFGGGPTGKDYVPSATWKDGQFQMADLYDYSKMHPWLWKLLKGAGNMILPGAGSIGSAVVQQGVPRGIGDGKPNNASIRRLK